MKGEVYGKRDLFHLLEWTRNKLAEKVRFSWESNFNKGGKPDAQKKVILN
jgi:hypothetical protein